MTVTRLEPEASPRFGPLAKERTPALTDTGPEKVLAPERTTVPEVVLIRPEAPASLPEIVPLRTSKSLVADSVPPEPMIDPEVSRTVSTASSKVLTFRLPPLTLTRAKSERTLTPPMATVPVLIVVAPPKELLPVRVSVPEPFLVSAADRPPDITPVKVVLLEPVMVSVRVPAEILPAIVSVPASDWTEVSPESVIGPPKVLLPVRLRRAPKPPKPVPVRSRGSEVMLTLPWSSSEAPEATTVPPTASPRPLAPLTLTVPALTLTAPWKVLLPPSVSLPLPVFVRPVVVPVMAPEMTVLPVPVKVTSLTSATIAVALLSVRVPTSDWMVVAPPRVTVPPKVFAPK